MKQALDAIAAEMAREHLDNGHPLVVQTQGWSMWPLIRPGAWVTILPLDGKPITTGDVVLLAMSEKLALHRVVGRRGSQLVIKGDACVAIDGLWPEHAMLGRLKASPWDRSAARASRVLGPALWGLTRLPRFIDQLKGRS